MDAAIWSAQLGITHPEDDRPLTLAEAAQIGLCDREQKQFRNVQTGQYLSLVESQKFCPLFVQRRLIQLGVLTLPLMTLEQALNSGVMHPTSGMFFHGKYLEFPLSLQEAIARGFIHLLAAHLLVAQPLFALTLTDCIKQRFINADSGKFEGNQKNRDGSHFTLHDAMCVFQPPLINGKVRECINTATGRRLTVEEAVAEGVLNLNTGTFTDIAKQKEMSLGAAHRLGLVMKPRTLTEMIEDGLVDQQGLFIDRGQRFTLLEAIGYGLLDAEVRHIKPWQNGEVISIGDAVAQDLLKPEGKLAVELADDGVRLGVHLLELQEAHDRGVLMHRARLTVFDVKSVKNMKNGTMCSFNEAVQLGIIQMQNGQIWYRTEQQAISFSDALARNLISPTFAEIFTGKQYHCFKDGGNRMSLLVAVTRGLIDTTDGMLIHPNNKNKMCVRDGYDLGLFISLHAAIKFAAICDIHPFLINSV